MKQLHTTKRQLASAAVGILTVALCAATTWGHSTVYANTIGIRSATDPHPTERDVDSICRDIENAPDWRQLPKTSLRGRRELLGTLDRISELDLAVLERVVDKCQRRIFGPPFSIELSDKIILLNRHVFLVPSIVRAEIKNNIWMPTAPIACVMLRLDQPELGYDALDPLSLAPNGRLKFNENALGNRLENGRSGALLFDGAAEFRYMRAAFGRRPHAKN